VRKIEAETLAAQRGGVENEWEGDGDERIEVRATAVRKEEERGRFSVWELSSHQ
jgi:hypothetical protein